MASKSTYRSAARQLGLSLVELMVALVLGLLVVGAANGVFLSNRQTNTATESQYQFAAEVRARVESQLGFRVGGKIVKRNAELGDSVKAGQEVARIDPTEARARLRQAQQQADAAKSQVDINQRQYNNNRALVDQGFISTTALVTSQASLEAAQSSYQAAVSAADVARKALEDTVLKSPISGLVAQRLAQPGERVPIDARIIEVVDLSRLELEALLTPADSVGVRVGQKAQLTVEGASAPVQATVVRINPSAQAGSRTVPV